MTIGEAFVKISGDTAIVSDGRFSHPPFCVRARGVGYGDGLATVRIERAPSALELTYETATGRITDVDDAAVEMEVANG